MRSLVWLLFLFALAVGAALFLADNHGMVTIFWPPHRIDMSANFAALALLVSFIVVHLLLRGLAILLGMPEQARRWRRKHQERAQQQGLLDAMAHWTAGRYLRGRKAAESVIEQTESLLRNEQASFRDGQGARIMALAHLLAAECAHALQDRARRDEHAQAALAAAAGETVGAGDGVNRGAVRMRDAQEVHEGVQLRMARWAYEDRDAQAALRRMDDLPQGVARRLAALRLRLRVTRLAGKPQAALETVRLLSKHRAFSDEATQSIVRGLVSEVLRGTHDRAQLLKAWEVLEPAERGMPEAALQAGERMLTLSAKDGGDFAQVLRWLEPVWEQLVRPALPVSATASMSAASVVHSATASSALRLRLVLLLERGFEQTPPDAAWLARIEAAQMTSPGDPLLQYLAGMACMHLSLWGKAQQLLKQSLTQLKDETLRRRAWARLARLAEQREDGEAALAAWRQAAQV